MINILEYARIAHDVYGDPFKMSPLTHKHPENKIYRITTVDPTMHPDNPCFAALYVKFHNRQATDAVIAIRGTQSFTDAKVDFDAWKSDVEGGRYDTMPAYYPQVFSFYRLALRYVQQHFGLSKVTFTGHSLGGALAQLLVGLGKQPFMAVTFNSPGTAHIPGVSTEMGSLVHGINSRYGFINKIGEPLGNIMYVDVPQEEKVAKQAFELYQQRQKTTEALVSNHSLIEEITLSKLFDAESQTLETDFILSAYPQHSIRNMIGALKHHPEVGQRVLG
jgi:pimeloyl-ACP methyl ester carboxylesterase